MPLFVNEFSELVRSPFTEISQKQFPFCYTHLPDDPVNRPVRFVYITFVLRKKITETNVIIQNIKLFAYPVVSVFVCFDIVQQML